MVITATRKSAEPLDYLVLPKRVGGSSDEVSGVQGIKDQFLGDVVSRYGVNAAHMLFLDLEHDTPVLEEKTLLSLLSRSLTIQVKNRVIVGYRNKPWPDEEEEDDDDDDEKEGVESSVIR